MDKKQEEFVAVDEQSLESVSGGILGLLGGGGGGLGGALGGDLVNELLGGLLGALPIGL
jgi:hypothetical protein